ncbi:uncharacterized protein [Musca autumnalis]|uniref:uncharacterized protein n=1 Tax=Musca autumnalis TaxID=221902 RepID=UPI003CF7E8D2
MSHQEGLKSNFNCNKCNEVDNDDMVQCDKCDKWYHFNCVGVNSSVSEVSWSCDGCNLNKETTSMEENQSAANTIGLLNVPQATSSPTNAGELLQMASKTTSGTGGRIPTASTTSTSVNRPTNTLFQGKAKDNRTNTVPSSLVPVNSSAITGTHSSTSNINQQNPVSSQQNNNVTLQVDLQLKMLEEQQRMQQEFLERKYQILSQCSQQEQTHQNSFNMTSNWNIFSGPTPSQLAARHSIPRDLPHFHGDPEEWPLFISSFENSTAVAGYSHAENLIRLQSCLKDNWKLAVPLKIREGLWNQPIATKTRLGWTIQGPNDCYRPGSWLNIHHCDCQEKYNELHQMVKENFNLEDSSVKTVVSAQDSMSMNILKTSCQNVDGRYEVGLLWKYNVKQLPESYNNARKRLTCLQKKFQKDKNLRDVLQEQINNLLKKGYARKLSDEEISNNGYPVWYLPTFITLNPNKPGKIRMVWDGAAKSNGVCLNDFIHCGPDLLKSLVDILLSFRVGKIAICGDIAEMFHRINVRKEDMHAQRFLWCDENDNPEKPSIYVMRALTFGICCAPCIAHYVRDFNAEQFKNEFPRAVEAIQQYHYVDDFIDSVNDDEQAIELASQVQYIHSAGGFHIRNWSSNSNGVISHLQDDSSKDQKPRDLAETEKVLGMYWDPNKDSFVYIFRFARLRRDLFASELIPTKRELLQVLMSIFDPLGLISCYTTTLKILLQEVWRSGIDWDDEICNPLHVKWRKWKTAIDYISSIEISRCYSPHINEATEVELHTFVDAGEDAYAAVCYLRVAYQGGCDVTIVIGKSKVAPIKPMSIPRLELQAAIAGVRLANKVINIKRINFTSKYFWTDSKTVLQWLRMDPKKFQQFVMHRVGEILETTEVTQWRWVPSKMNPADLATKYQTRWDAAMWFSGPKFLHENKSTWPTCTNVDDEGILRARGRVLYLNHQDTIILPTMHHVTVLLVRYVHENFHHISHETVINNIKSQYYIPKLRVLYKSIRRSCQHCKNLSANPVMPQMSTLPKARLASFERPFTYVGIDYFGPLYVTVGRRKEKRWGVLFTCLTVRAVHIEIAYSLDTSSCVMCINNFIARRGIPNEIYTDNGTNFKATAKIFSPESKAFDLKDTASMLDHIKWKFNPPAAPHMGGAWERLVRSVKTTVYTICPNANFNDETLRNAMAEAEFIINSRPLTFVSLESCDDEALTPNHLLLGSSSGYKPIVTETVDLRLRWRQTQQFSDQFWRRWVKEYMPTLTRRGKWFQKTEPLKVGDIVIIIDENLPRHCWPKGKIINTIIAKDGQVRQATVRTQHGVFQRPTAKLAKLDVGIIDQ